MPIQRIRIQEIKSHPWFLKKLPTELKDAAQAVYYRRENPTYSLQSVEQIMRIVDEAKIAPSAWRSFRGFGWGGKEEETDEDDIDEDDIDEEDEDEYEKLVNSVHGSGVVRLT